MGVREHFSICFNTTVRNPLVNFHFIPLFLPHYPNDFKAKPTLITMKSMESETSLSMTPVMIFLKYHIFER